MEDDANAGVAARRNWRLIKPNVGAETKYFVGYVSKFETNSITNSGRIQVNFEITVDGDLTIVR